MKQSVCDSKLFYDTEFEAEIAASKTAFRVKREMIHYKCGSHWHVANKAKKDRGKHSRYQWCDPCKVTVRKKRIIKHVATRYHQIRVNSPRKVEDEH